MRGQVVHVNALTSGIVGLTSPLGARSRAVPRSAGRGSYAPEMAPDPTGDSGDAVTEVIGTVSDVIEEVADDVGDFLGRMRDDLLGRDGYLVVLVMTILVVVAIPIDAAFRGGGIVTVSAIGLLVFTTMSRSKVSHRLRVASGVVIAISFALAIGVTITDNASEARSYTWLAATFAMTYTVMIGLCFPAILRHAFNRRR